MCSVIISPQCSLNRERTGLLQEKLETHEYGVELLSAGLVIIQAAQLYCQSVALFTHYDLPGDYFLSEDSALFFEVFLLIARHSTQ